MTQIKGVYNATAPTVRDRQNEDIQLDVNGNLKQTLATALDKNNDSITAYPKACVTVNLTASGQILAAPGTCVAIEIVSFTTGATVRLSDALTATTPYISSAITLTLDGTTKTGHKAGDEIFKNIVLLTGGYVTISGTCEIIAKVIAA